MKQLDPRQSKSIEKLHNAYINLLRKGYEQLSIQQICDEANVTRPTFYKSFKDVLELRQSIHEKILLQLQDALTIANPQPLDEIAREQMNYHLVLLFEHIREHKQAYEVFVMNQPDAQFINGLKEVLAQYVSDGIYYSRSMDRLIDVDVEFLISYVLGAYLESIVWWMKDGYQKSAKFMANILIEISLYGPYKKE